MKVSIRESSLIFTFLKRKADMMKKILFIFGCLLLVVTGCSVQQEKNPSEKKVIKESSESSELIDIQATSKNLTDIVYEVLEKQNQLDKEKVTIDEGSVAYSDLVDQKVKGDTTYKNVKEVVGQYTFEGKAYAFDLIVSLKKANKYKDYTVLRWINEQNEGEIHLVN